MKFPKPFTLTWDAIASSVTENMLRVNEVLTFPYVYEQQLIKYIDDSGRDHIAQRPADVLNGESRTIKIEGYERFSKAMERVCQTVGEYFAHEGPVTAHLFIAKISSPSFAMHTDPCDVVLYVLEGTKCIEFDDGTYINLRAGQVLFIPRNYAHCACNYAASTMVSFGLESYMTEMFPK